MKTLEETIELIAGRQVAAKLSGVQNIWDDNCLWLIAEIYETGVIDIVSQINIVRENMITSKDIK